MLRTKQVVTKHLISLIVFRHEFYRGEICNTRNLGPLMGAYDPLLGAYDPLLGGLQPPIHPDTLIYTLGLPIVNC